MGGEGKWWGEEAGAGGLVYEYFIIGEYLSKRGGPLSLRAVSERKNAKSICIYNSCGGKGPLLQEIF